MIFLWLKVFHIISVVAWMAGLLVYPRYKIHQLKDEPGGLLFETMKDSAILLRKIILTPAMMGTWIFGLGMVASNPAIIGVGGGFWFPIKLFLVIVLTGFHGWFTATGRKIDAQTAGTDAKRLRLLNEVPFILLIVITILVVIKPF